MNWITYLIIVAILAAMITPLGLLFFGITILAGSIIGILFFYFMPAILVLLGIAILAKYIPIPGIQLRLLSAALCFVGAWALWNGVL